MTTSIDTLRMIPEGRARDAIYAFAFAMLRSEQLDPAVKAFRVLVRFAPTDERAWLGLAACHEKRGEPDVAEELYGAGAIVASPPSARCHLALARIVRARGEGDLAREHLETACGLVDSDDAELVTLLEHERHSS
jgi:Tfp pilus assembly protein PilF